MMKFLRIDLGKVALTFLLSVTYGFTTMAAPIINSFTPSSGTIGTTVNITGANFNTTAGNNIVFFGAVRATVSSATATSLTVTVPAGATYQPISVTDLTTKLSGYSAKPFITTFAGAAGIDAGSFASQTDFVTNTSPYCVTIADLDGDGKADVVTANYGSDNISIFRNTSTGGIVTFDAGITISADYRSISVAIGDLDGDGKPEIVVTNYGTTTVNVFHNNSTSGTISFNAKTDLTVGANPRSVAIGDLDGDGKPEIVTSNYGTTTISILQNSSTAGVMAFAPKVDLTVGSNPYCVAISDIDGDGKPDLSVANGNSNSISILHNKSTIGTISYDLKVDFATGTSPVNLAVGDLDGDGKTDIVVSNNLSNSISILYNKSTAGIISLDPKLDFTTGTAPMSASLADLDGDGKLDIAVANYSSSNISIYHNASTIGTILLTNKYDFAIGTNPRGVGICDLDNDGKPDISVAYEYSSFSVLKNISAAPVISFFAPTIAGAGTNVVITGTNLTGTTQVTFGGIAAQSFKVISSTSISAVVGNGSTGNISVNMPRGTASKAGFTFSLYPTISSFAPTSGAAGTTVIITGTNFNTIAANNIVFFGATKATVTAATSSSISVVVPTGATYQPISITDITIGYTVYSVKPFIITFAGGSTFDAGTFYDAISYDTGTNPFSVTISDLDGDGKSDLIVTNFLSGNIFVYRNTSTSGIVSFAPKIIYVTGSEPTNAISGDIDGDGKPDIAITNYNSNSISIFRNTSIPGTISFAVKTDLTTNENPRNIAIGDLDGNGKPDLAVTNYNSASVSVFKNTSTLGSISFSSKLDLTTEIGPFGISISDIDGDGKPEILVTNEQNQTFSVFLNTSIALNISFAAKKNFATMVNPLCIPVGDLDSDGKPDITVVGFNSTIMSIFRNKSTVGTILFDTSIDYTAGANPYGVSYSDLDGDGKLDLVVANSGGTNISTYRNTSISGTISMTGAVNYNVNKPISVALGDMDGDGRADIAVTSDDNNVSIIRNTNIPPIISSFTPTSGLKGTTVSITGTNLIGTTAVSFGETAATAVTVVSSNQVTAIVSDGTSGNVSITNSRGTSFLPGFTYNTLKIPSITSFSPTSAINGIPIEITGTNFIGTTAVNFGGTPATSFIVNSSTSITAIVATGSSGNVNVTAQDGTGTMAGFKFISPPSIISFTPSAAKSNETITITGNNFLNATEVSFGGVAAKSFVVVSETIITAIVESGSGKISIVTPGGNAAIDGFIFYQMPTITSITPTLKINEIQVTGTNLSGTTNVKFEGIATSFTVLSNTSIITTIASGTTGNLNITTTGGTAIFFVGPPPIITTFTPNSGLSETLVTITGTNFENAMNVNFGGTKAKSFTVVSSTSITAIVDKGSSGIVNVTTPFGTATLDGFIFTGPPTINSFSPNGAGFNQSISIFGAGFTGATEVKFGNSPAVSFIVVSATTINAVSGKGSSGAVSVTTPNGTSTLEGFKYIEKPTITSFLPTNCYKGAIVTIKGTAFKEAGMVLFGDSLAASFTIVSDTIISAIVGNGTSGKVSVITLGGEFSLNGFQYLVTSIENIKDNEITIYPNPVLDYLYFKNSPNDIKEVMIYDINGRLVSHKKINNQTINLQTLNSGIYILKIGNAYYKIIKQ